MTCNFRVGQKVVKFWQRPGKPTCISIEVGTVLTIRAVQTTKRIDGNVHTGLLFEEIRNEVIDTAVGPFELDYDHRCFRPVVERKTDISIFKAMLEDKKARADA